MTTEIDACSATVDPWTLDVLLPAIADRNRVATRTLSTPFGGMNVATLLGPREANGEPGARPMTDGGRPGERHGAASARGKRSQGGPARRSPDAVNGEPVDAVAARRPSIGALAGYACSAVAGVHRRGFSLRIGPYWLTVMDAWRIATSTGDVLLGSSEWQRAYTILQEADDAFFAEALLLGRRVVHATAVGSTADLTVRFSGGHRLETWSDSRDAATWLLARRSIARPRGASDDPRAAEDASVGASERPPAAPPRG